MHWIDPDSLKKTKGTVECFIFNPKGLADGLIFTDGTEVHFPPHMSEAVLAAIRVGDTVTVRGVKPRDADLLAAVAIETAKGRRLIDGGPDDDECASPLERQRGLRFEGKVRMLLHGPKGETRGVMLADGTAGRFPPHVAERLLERLRTGRHIILEGDGYSGDLGGVIEVRAIGGSKGPMTKVEPAPHHKKKRPKHHHIA